MNLLEDDLVRKSIQVIFICLAGIVLVLTAAFLIGVIIGIMGV